MIGKVRGWCVRFRRLCQENDPVLVLAGGEAERQLAYVRLVICGLLLIMPTHNLIRYPEVAIHRYGFAVTCAGALAATLIWWFMRRGLHQNWIGFASSAVDISLVTLALGLFMLVDSPLTALNSRVTFEIYFLALTAAALRYDRRICLMAGLLAIVQYASLLGWGLVHYDLVAEARLRSDLGSFEIADQVTRLILLASAVILAWHLVGRAQRLLVISNRDPLTGVGNRTFFETMASAEIVRATRYDRPCTLVVLDVDHFKRFNDVHGHVVGDQVLKSLATVLMSHARATDVVARWGGEEFVLVLPELGLGDALPRLEQIRRAVAETVLDVPGHRGPRQLTVSIGAANLPADGHDLATLFAIADARMLAAKRLGRDRVVLTDDTVAPPLEPRPWMRVTPIGGLQRITPTGGPIPGLPDSEN